MGILSTALKASIERLRDLTFTTPIQILRRSDASNGAGGVASEWPVVATYQGRLRHSRQTDYLRISGEEELPTGAWLVMIPTSADVSPADRIRVATCTFAI